MPDIVGVRFKDSGKIYYFDPDKIMCENGEAVIVETARGIECGFVAIPNKRVTDKEITHPLKKVLRKATNADLKKLEKNRQKETKAVEICLQKIAEHNLDMKLINAEYTFDNSKVLFYFTADGRIDFRNLVKDLASVLRTRIELRQIGVRDEAKILGGLGICGRPFCCKTFLGDFQPVSIKMAKEQGLSLNPAKISGTCGRLMCCLKYEQDSYEYLIKTTPTLGSTVKTPSGVGVVTEVSLLTGMVKVDLSSSGELGIAVFNKKDLKVLREKRGKSF